MLATEALLFNIKTSPISNCYYSNKIEFWDSWICLLCSTHLPSADLNFALEWHHSCQGKVFFLHILMIVPLSPHAKDHFIARVFISEKKKKHAHRNLSVFSILFEHLLTSFALISWLLAITQLAPLALIEKKLQLWVLTCWLWPLLWGRELIALVWRNILNQSFMSYETVLEDDAKFSSSFLPISGKAQQTICQKQVSNKYYVHIFMILLPAHMFYY